MLKIIGFCAPAPFSGKTSAARVLIEMGYTHISFATPVKQSMTAFLEAIGIKGCGEYIWGNQKGDVIPELGVTGGFLLSTFATEYVRDKLGRDIWLDAAQRKIEALPTFSDGNKYIVIDDLRFPNEAEWIHSMGGIVCFVERPDAPSHDRSMKSEGLLNDFPHNHHIVNNGTLADLENIVLQIANEI